MRKLIYIIIITLLCFDSGNAQTLTSSGERKVPNLNGHTFPSVFHFNNSFINTSLEANLGFGLTSPVRISGLVIDDHELFAFEGQILFINTRVRYQQRFNPWLALYMSFEMAGRVGTDMSTILADGVNTLVGGNIGWLIRIMQTNKFNLSGTVYIQNLTGNFINVSEYFQELINNDPNPTVVKKVPAMVVGVGTQGAYAFNSTFGLQFQAACAFGESFQREKSAVFYSLGILGDVDFMSKHNVPVSLALGYTLISEAEIVLEDGAFINLISGRIGYTGSSDFELGLQYSYNKVNLKSVDKNPSVSTIMLILKFYF
ncbi:MAG: hypothetical protein U9R60_18715 [Bacteroidota bacterium]|nr:hypothetical protein [Bacteroidota bacterium]